MPTGDPICETHGVLRENKFMVQGGVLNARPASPSTFTASPTGQAWAADLMTVVAADVAVHDAIKDGTLGHIVRPIVYVKRGSTLHVVVVDDDGVSRDARKIVVKDPDPMKIYKLKQGAIVHVDGIPVSLYNDTVVETASDLSDCAALARGGGHD